MNPANNPTRLHPKPQNALPDIQWKGKRILIVEEDYVNYLYFHEILSQAGACLIRAVTVQEAIEMISGTAPFDLIIMNTGIPGNENCKAMQRIKLNWPALHVLAIAGCSCRENQKNCRINACDTFMTFNVDCNELILVINELFYPSIDALVQPR